MRLRAVAQQQCRSEAWGRVRSVETDILEVGTTPDDSVEQLGTAGVADEYGELLDVACDVVRGCQ